jgi:phosphomannomutase
MKKARLKVVYDPMYGTGRGYLDSILRDAGCRVTMIHNDPDPSFGGGRPEPLPEFLTELRSRVRRVRADLGLATDGDADRMAVCDSDCTYLAADQLFPMLFDYLIKDGGHGGVVRTVATTHLVDKIAQRHGLPVYEVPVGFKYVGQYLREKDVLIGAEESGGMSFKGHISKKDGIFTCIKTTEMRAKTGKSLSKIFNELMSEYGPCVSGRDDVPCPDSLKKVVMEELSSGIPDKVGDTKVSSVNRMDGIKLLLEDGGWLLIRPSGTEPLLRVYGESADKRRLRENLEQGKNIVLKLLGRLSVSR